MNLTYKSDFYAWTQDQADALRAGKLNQLDVKNLLKEVEGLGLSERNQLIASLTVLLSHLLQWKYQPQRRTRSCKLTIKEQRNNVSDYLKYSPSLKHDLGSFINKAFEHATKQTAQPICPKSCPWSFEQIMDTEFYPQVLK